MATYEDDLVVANLDFVASIEVSGEAQASFVETYYLTRVVSAD
jgi:hypothetical protein